MTWHLFLDKCKIRGASDESAGRHRVLATGNCPMKRLKWIVHILFPLRVIAQRRKKGRKSRKSGAFTLTGEIFTRTFSLLGYSCITENCSSRVIEKSTSHWYAIGTLLFIRSEKGLESAKGNVTVSRSNWQVNIESFRCFHDLKRILRDRRRTKEKCQGENCTAWAVFYFYCMMRIKIVDSFFQLCNYLHWKFCNISC